jgi:hypothetical protein
VSNLEMPTGKSVVIAMKQQDAIGSGMHDAEAHRATSIRVPCDQG